MSTIVIAAGGIACFLAGVIGYRQGAKIGLKEGENMSQLRLIKVLDKMEAEAMAVINQGGEPGRIIVFVIEKLREDMGLPVKEEKKE